MEHKNTRIDREGMITAGELRKMIADLADDESIVFIKEDGGIGGNASAIEFEPACVGEDGEKFPPFIYVID